MKGNFFMINERDVFIDEVCYSAKKIEWFKATTKSRFHLRITNYEGFNEITDEKRNELIKEAKVINEKTLFKEQERIKNYKYYIILSYINKVNTFNKFYTPQESIILLIEAVDPKLIALKIFLKSKNDKNIELQSNKILGFYDPKLIEYEREYAKRFNKSNSSVLIKKLGKKS